jgi:hypothetical protein
MESLTKPTHIQTMQLQTLTTGMMMVSSISTMTSLQTELSHRTLMVTDLEIIQLVATLMLSSMKSLNGRTEMETDMVTIQWEWMLTIARTLLETQLEIA